MIAKHDGHILNGGWLSLLYADDKSEASHASLDKDDDGVFQFSFVPEGDYILRADGGSDVEYVEIPNPPHSSPPTRSERNTLHQYGSGDLPIHVEGDISGLTIPVPDLPEQTVRPNPEPPKPHISAGSEVVH
jgi:hypothetical protein